MCYWIAGFAGYFALFAAATRNDTSFVSWLANALGLFYGTALYISGLSAFYVACRSSWSARSTFSVAAAIPFSLLPAFVGLIGLVHGYINVYHILASSGTYPHPLEMFSGHATVLTCLLVGLGFSFISFGMLAIAMLVKCSPSPVDIMSDDGG